MSKATQKLENGFEAIVSSNLHSAKFENGVITVRFQSGSAYEHTVPEGDTGIWAAWRNTFNGKVSSPGKHYHAQIKMLPYKRIDDWK